jgi:hypothetical protein
VKKFLNWVGIIASGRHIFQFRGCVACYSAGGYLNLSEAEQAVRVCLQSLPAVEYGSR